MYMLKKKNHSNVNKRKRISNAIKKPFYYTCTLTFQIICNKRSVIFSLFLIFNSLHVDWIEKYNFNIFIIISYIINIIKN